MGVDINFLGCAFWRKEQNTELPRTTTGRVVENCTFEISNILLENYTKCWVALDDTWLMPVWRPELWDIQEKGQIKILAQPM